jgi:hypothetical protein
LLLVVTEVLPIDTLTPARGVVPPSRVTVPEIVPYWVELELGTISMALMVGYWLYGACSVIVILPFVTIAVVERTIPMLPPPAAE